MHRCFDKLWFRINLILTFFFIISKKVKSASKYHNLKSYHTMRGRCYLLEKTKRLFVFLKMVMVFYCIIQPTNSSCLITIDYGAYILTNGRCVHCIFILCKRNVPLIYLLHFHQWKRAAQNGKRKKINRKEVGFLGFKSDVSDGSSATIKRPSC